MDDQGMKLTVQPHQASHGRRLAIVDEHGDTLLTTWDTSEECRYLAQMATAAPDLLASLERLATMAERRENVMGDVLGLLHCKAELAAAAAAARVLISNLKALKDA